MIFLRFDFSAVAEDDDSHTDEEKEDEIEQGEKVKKKNDGM